MIVLITDPMTNRRAMNPDKHAFIIQGSGHNALKIYFESQDSKNTYIKSNALKVPATNE